jgi:hypothetical protein
MNGQNRFMEKQNTGVGARKTHKDTDNFQPNEVQ